MWRLAAGIVSSVSFKMYSRAAWIQCSKYSYMSISVMNHSTGHLLVDVFEWISLTFVFNRISLLLRFVDYCAQMKHIAIVEIPLIVGIVLEHIETFLNSSLHTAQPRVNRWRLINCVPIGVRKSGAVKKRIFMHRYLHRRISEAKQ